MLVHNFLEECAERLPEKIGVVFGERRLTYAQVESAANRLANALIDRGVVRGDRVALWLGNGAELVISIFAVLKAGGVFVVINRSTKVRKLLHILNNCQVTGLVTGGSDMFAEASTLATEVPTLRLVVIAGSSVSPSSIPTISFDAAQAAYSDIRPRSLAIDLDLACLIYTSGSTGEPQGVMSDHSNIVFASDSIVSYLNSTADDVVLNTLPLSFDYGLYQLFMCFRVGGTLILEESFAFPATILKKMKEEKVSGLPCVPMMIGVLLRMELAAYDLSHLRYITNTAAAMPPHHVCALRKKLPGVQIYSMYGLTETKRTLYLPPDEIEARPDSVGIPIPGTETWIEGEGGNRLGADEVGELIVRGRHVMRGYWGAPEATAERFVPGPLPGERICRTGDLFRTDKDGFYYFVARKDDIIKIRGEKVAPKEIENALYLHPGVLEAAVIGVPDAVTGEALVAFIVTEDPNLNSRDVISHCSRYLEQYLVPKRIEFRTFLPKTSTGKIAKQDLR
jgi:long-chain acyl-CoA synthetase